jgi:hypothetical protein
MVSTTTLDTVELWILNFESSFLAVEGSVFEIGTTRQEPGIGEGNGQ